MSENSRVFYEFGRFRLDEKERRLLRDGAEVTLTENGKAERLTPKAFDLLLVLVKQSGEMVGRDDLLEQVWPGTFVEDNRLSDNVSTLRKFLSDRTRSPQFIETVPKHGYRFVADVHEVRDEVVALVEETKTRVVIEEDDEASPVSDHIYRAAEVKPEPAIEARLQNGTRRRWWRASRLVPAGVAIALITASTIWLRNSGRSEREAPLPLMKTVQFTSMTTNEFDPALSPDGKLVAFARTNESGNALHIYVKQIGAGEPLQLTSAVEMNRDSDPAWSPDGLLIAFIRITPDMKGSGIFTVPALGGPERKLLSLEKFLGNAGLDWSPDGKHIAFTARLSAQRPFSIYLLSVETQQLQQLTSGPSVTDIDSRMAFSPDGQTISFVRGDHGTGDVYLIATTGGEPRRLTSDNRSIIGQSWTADGTQIVFASNRAGGGFTLWRVPVSGGNPEPVPLGSENALDPHISRAGNRLVFTKATGDTNIWRRRLTDSPSQTVAPSLLISSSRHDRNPALSPDGQKIAFESSRTGNLEIWMCDAAGLNAVQLTSFDGPVTGNPHWSPDGRQVAFESRTEAHADIHVVNVEGGSPQRLTVEASNEVSPSWSRDGRWIYFGSDRSGIYQVWKIPSAGGAAIQVTQNGGYELIESVDGQFLYYTKYRTPGIYRAPVAGGEEVMVLDLPDLASWDDWAIVSDGIYFLDRKPLPRATIQFFDFAQRRTSPVASLEKDPGSDPGLNISADRGWLIYSQCDVCNADIMLVENFR